MLATVVLLIALQSPPSAEVQNLRMEMQRIQLHIAALELKLKRLETSGKTRKIVKQINEARMELDRSRQDLASMETLLAGYIAADRAISEQRHPDALQKYLDRFKKKYHVPYVIPIPPEHPAKASSSVV